MMMRTREPVIVGRVGPSSDEALARAAARGDQTAFGELVRRYRAMIGWAAQRPVMGATREDLRQAALLGLFEACRAHDPRRGAFRSMAAACMVNHVRGENQRAGSSKQRVLTYAVSLDGREHDGSGSGRELPTLAERLPDREGVDPARVAEARERLVASAAVLPRLTPKYRAALAADDAATTQLRWLARERLKQLVERQLNAPPPPPPVPAPRYTPAQINRALQLVQAGSSVGHAAFVVGADKKTVSGWLCEAAA